MKLQDLLKYKKITIQCHDNPDADSIGSGFALLKFFESRGVSVRLVYGGRFEITKVSLKILIEELDIPIEYLGVESRRFDGLLLTVDCQHGAGNVTTMFADEIAVIDHHVPEVELPKLSRVEESCGSAGTLVYFMLKEAGFNIEENRDLQTALYYGLYSDTYQFRESYGEQDKVLRDEAKINRTLFNRLKHANISLNDLETAGIALLRNIYNESGRYSVMQANPCDPNLLGLLADFLLQVDVVDFCVCYNALEDGFKFSVRSSVREVHADDLCEFLTKEIGTGGGRRDKAGGFISKKLYEQNYGTMNSEAYFSEKINDFLKL
ncbi:MAG: DHH family phosphoesterase [Lachnospiraceae bacterium]|nr:DHH family phosphoesterase [Lachnospiraceae bacterium]